MKDLTVLEYIKYGTSPPEKTKVLFDKLSELSLDEEGSQEFLTAGLFSFLIAEIERLKYKVDCIEDELDGSRAPRAKQSH